MNERPRAAHYRLRARCSRSSFGTELVSPAVKVGDEAVWKRRFFPFTV